MGQPATAASDRYALAVVAYELLTGRRPFAGGPVTAQARQHVEDEPEPASEAEPELPPAIDAAFARGLAKDPRDRPHTTVGLIEEIERALGGPVATESTRAMKPVVPDRARRRPAGRGRRRCAARPRRRRRRADAARRGRRRVPRPRRTPHRAPPAPPRRPPPPRRPRRRPRGSPPPRPPRRR